MKKFTILFLLVLSSNTSFAQSTFDKFDGKDDVTAIIINKKMFQMMSNVKVDINDKETQQYLTLIRKLDNLKVFTTSSAAVTIEMKSSVDNYFKTASLEELMRTSDPMKNIRILIKPLPAKDQVKELLMFIEGQNKETQTVLMSLTGNFALSEISLLIDKMKIPGSLDLKKATITK
jgi:alpha-acetolactate decarboxylase